MKDDDKIKKIVWTGLLTAMVAVGTMIRVPYPMANGYLNAGDAIVMVSAFLLTPWCGAFAAGVGSALTDFLYGMAIYAPATLVIKGCMALAAGASAWGIRTRVAGRIAGTIQRILEPRRSA